MKRTVITEAINLVGNNIKVCGWIHSNRSHGKMVFIDIRDRSGILQVVFLANLSKDIIKKAQQAKEESVVEIVGKINKRPDDKINKEIESGSVEMEAQNIEILTQSKTLPFPIDDNGYKINEEIRLKYRYLDLRRKRLQKNILLRQKTAQFIRNYLGEKKFIEIETPILTKSTPEGARDFLVPSRLNKGKFYALPQSPQQYKQLLMVAGFERYFQFPHVFRDEDLRADRLFEHTQLDIEMSFVEEKDILELVEEMIITITKKVFQKEIQQIPFPKISYKEAMEKYKSDRPDLRDNKDKLAFCWIINFPMFEILEDGSIDAVHHPFTALKDNDLETFKKMDVRDLRNDKKKLLSLEAKQYDLVLNGVEVMGGSIRTHQPEILKKVFEVLGHSKEAVEERFGHILEAFQYGVPPHGGIAAGFDRLLQTILGEKSIRETVAFPTNTNGKTAVMDAPSNIDTQQLKELNLKIAEKNEVGNS
jgi:aspartyl-tRNA synthetase